MQVMRKRPIGYAAAWLLDAGNHVGPMARQSVQLCGPVKRSGGEGRNRAPRSLARPPARGTLPL